jgi:hypothetical protein
MIVTDAWEPQVNGVVRSLQNTRRELEAMGHTVELITPLEFKTLPCPTYPDIRLSLLPNAKVAARIEACAPEWLHIATEGPLGIAARRYAVRRRMAFTTAYHTRFPEYVRARTGLPLAVTYRFLRWFHDPARHVMVPTPAMREELMRRGFTNTALWSRGVDTDQFAPGTSSALAGLPRPIFLNVGRVAVEKNIEAFLRLDLPGTKCVAGDGPLLATLRQRYPQTHFLGVLPHRELADLYRAADVFVFPSRTDTFGLVLLEAMACGLPVAAYPVEGPIDVVGSSGAGALDEDLRTACMKALEIPREAARRHAQGFSWRAATEQFLGLQT